MNRSIHEIMVRARSLGESAVAERAGTGTVRYHRYPDGVPEIAENLRGIEDILEVSYRMLKRQGLSYGQVKNLNRARELILDVIDSLDVDDAVPDRGGWW